VGTDWLTVWSIGRYDFGLSEREIWALTLEEFGALIERYLAARDFQERIAAAAPWAIFNVHRGPNTPFLPLSQFLLPSTALRLQPAPARAAPAGEPVPVPGQPLPPGWWMGKYGPVREAPMGARPPSSRPPGVADDLIARIDAYSTRVNARRVN
jgi:hypothetical protein